MALQTPFSNIGDTVEFATAVEGETGRESVQVVNDIAPGAIIKVLLALGSVWLLIRAAPVLLLIACALLLVAAFNPLVRRLQKRMGRSWASLGVVVGAVALIVGMLALLIPVLVNQGSDLIRNSPHYLHELQQTLRSHGIKVNLERQISLLTEKVSVDSPQMMNVLTGAINGIAGIVTVAVLTTYLLIEGPEVGKSLSRLLPRRRRLGARKLVAEVGGQVGNYVRGQLITSAMAGIYSVVVLAVLGVPEALALGALAALMDAVPIIGFLAATVPAALAALALSPGKAITVVVFYIIYHQVESNYIVPKVYGSTLGLSLTAVILSFLLGAQLMGIMGAILALPVAAAIPSIVRYIQEWQGADEETA